jgi:hypothetical protein
MRYGIYCTLILLFGSFFMRGQFSLSISSQVEQDGKGLGGASISLYQGSKLMGQTISEPDGDFTIEVPANGEFIIQVSYADCNTKKFYVSTRGVPPEVASDNFTPGYRIGGFTMKKPLYSIDYSALKNPLLKILYFPDQGKFDHDDPHTGMMLKSLERIRDAEKALIEKQLAAVKEGDAALKKKDCALAKTCYEKAVSIIPQMPYEEYPKAQISKCDNCMAEKKTEEQKAAQQSQLDAEKKAADEKAKADRLAKEEEERKKKADDDLKKKEQQKIAAEKASNEKALLDKEKSEPKTKEPKTPGVKEIAKAPVENKSRSDEKGEKAKTQEVASRLSSLNQKEIKEKRPAETSSIPVVQRKERESQTKKKKVNKETKPKYSIPQVLGSDRYKTLITQGDEFLNAKQYDEARKVFEEALEYRPKDPYATGRLDQIDQVSPPKQ